MHTTNSHNMNNEQQPNGATPHTSASSGRPIIVGLDIGTTKIAAIAGRKNEFGKLEILGFGRAPSLGVQHGMVLNIEKTIQAISQAMEECFRSNPSLILDEVYVGIAGHHIKSLTTRGDIVRKNPEDEIKQDEIQSLIADQRRTYIPAGDQIIDVIPQTFSVDNFQDITDPIGMNGVKLGASFHIITGDRNAIKNIHRSVEKANLKTRDLVLQPLASAAAVMSDQDLESGVAIVDIGGGTTDLAIFYEGVLKHTAVIPFGGENITMDIKKGLGILKTQAEQLKIQFGCALVEGAKKNSYITIPQMKGLPPRQVSMPMLAEIIQARMSEILDFVSYHLKNQGLDHGVLNGGIILTGGGSQLAHLKQLTEYCTGLSARIGYPNEHLASGHLDELTKPVYSTCIGLILKGYNDFETGNPRFSESFMPWGNGFQQRQVAEVVMATTVEEPVQNEELETSVLDAESETEELSAKQRNSRKGLRKLFDSIKGGLVDIFKDEEDETF